MESTAVCLENKVLKVQIHPKGAELQRLYHKEYKLEYLWNADATYWPKYSPVLFPIVGALKDNAYLYKESTYKLSRHGFARDMMFEVESAGTDHATFTLKSSAETKANYPFDFILKLHYRLDGSVLEVKYEVINESDETLYFSIGAHPAFAVPFQEGTNYEDYFLEFEKKETAPRWTIKNSLIAEPRTYLENESKIPLKKELFYEDAIVLNNLESNRLSIKSDKTPHGLHFYFEGFPFMGIWAAKDAPFVCIEPWCGIADSVDHNQQFEKKEGVMALQPKTNWTKAWRVELF